MMNWSSRGWLAAPLTPPYMPFGIRRFNLHGSVVTCSTLLLFCSLALLWNTFSSCPKFILRVRPHIRFGLPFFRPWFSHCNLHSCRLFGPSLHLHYRDFITTMTLADFSPFVVTTRSLVRPHGISHQSFLVYLPNLPAWVTFAFWTSRLLARLSVMQA